MPCNSHSDSSDKDPNELKLPLPEFSVGDFEEIVIKMNSLKKLLNTAVNCVLAEKSEKKHLNNATNFYRLGELRGKYSILVQGVQKGIENEGKDSERLQRILQILQPTVDDIDRLLSKIENAKNN